MIYKISLYKSCELSFLYFSEQKPRFSSNLKITSNKFECQVHKSPTLQSVVEDDGEVKAFHPLLQQKQDFKDKDQTFLISAVSPENTSLVNLQGSILKQEVEVNKEQAKKVDVKSDPFR